MLAQQARLQLARELGMAPQRVAPVMTDSSMLGVRSWTSVLPRKRAWGKDEVLCLWLNSTFELLLRIMHGNRPYLGRSTVSMVAEPPKAALLSRVLQPMSLPP